VTSVERILVADVGATNARFGIAEAKEGGCYLGFSDLFEVSTLECKNFRGMDELIGAYLGALPFDVPRHGCLAVAGVSSGDLGSIDKRGWYFSIASMKAKYGFEKLEVVNDFAALAYSIPCLSSRDIANIHPVGNVSDNAPKVVVGAGTGFGVSALIPGKFQSWGVMSTCGGHSGFSPECDLEMAIKRLLIKRDGYVSIETVLSGKGLENLAFGISVIDGMERGVYTSEAIVSDALNGGNQTCKKAALTFLNILGGVAGDQALSFGASGGVFIGGGITPKLLPLLAESQFFERYRNKGPMTGYVETIPVSVILNDYMALVGAAIWYKHRVLNLNDYASTQGQG